MDATTDFPEMDSARDRLDSLLRNIRQQSNFPGAVSNGKRSSSARDEDDEQEGSDYNSDNDESLVSPYRSQSRPAAGLSSDQRRGSFQKLGKFSPTKATPGSVSSKDASAKKRRISQKKIIFELRQKAFEIQTPHIEHGLYALCRIWMRGKHTKDSVVTGQPIDRSNVDYDQEALLAAGAIVRKSTVRREEDREDPTQVTGTEESPSDILGQYLPRWRQAKKDWCQQRNKNDVEKYGDSLRVLREMHATAQNHVINM